MADAYCPFMGRKGRPWNELDLPSIAERVAGVPPEVESAARSLAAVCLKAGVSLEMAQEALKTAFDGPVSASSSKRARR